METQEKLEGGSKRGRYDKEQNVKILKKISQTGWEIKEILGQINLGTFIIHREDSAYFFIRWSLCKSLSDRISLSISESRNGKH